MLADPQCPQREARCIRAIEDVHHWDAGVFAAGTLDHGAPPAATGKQCASGRGEQRYRTADGKGGARVRQAVNDDCGMATSDHRCLITDICLTFK